MKAVSAVALVALGASVIAAAPALTAGQVEATIRAKGARRTIDDLARSGQWDTLTDAMDKGGSAWIALAPKLAPGSDAGSAEDLGISLAFALPRNPGAVLAALDPKNGHILGVDRVCGRPFIEDTEPRGYKAKALAALAGVRDPRLSAVKQTCLKALKSTN